MFGLFRRQPEHEYLRKGNRFWHMHFTGDELVLTWGEIDGPCLTRTFARDNNPKLEKMAKQLSRYMRREDGYQRSDPIDKNRCKTYPYERFYSTSGTYFRHTKEPRFWEIDRQGLTIVTREGELGTRGVVHHLAGCQSEKEAERRIYRMVSDKKADGFSRSMDAWVPNISLRKEAAAREQALAFRDDPGPVEGWPACLSHLEPPKRPRHQGVPAVLEQPYLERGVAPTKFPLTLTGVLGHCPTAAYPECKNLPQWHSTGHAGASPPDLGEYHWFDLSMLCAGGEAVMLRMVFNVGSADHKDGAWGEIWDRNTRVRIADMVASGDFETTVMETGEGAAYQPYEDWLPPTFGPGHPAYNTPCVSGVRYARGTRLERLIHVALIVAHLYIVDDREFLELLGYPTA